MRIGRGCVQDIFSAGCVLAEMFNDGTELFDLAKVLALVPLSPPLCVRVGERGWSINNITLLLGVTLHVFQIGERRGEGWVTGKRVSSSWKEGFLVNDFIV
jgi:hypothetical protein